MADQIANRDPNRVTTLLATSNIDNDSTVNLWADPVTHALLISGSISATNPSVGTNGATAPTSSTEIGIIDGSGNLQGVSASNPLPVGQSNTTDAKPATQNITTQDLSSTTATGANNQSIIIGNPTAGSAASFTLAGYATVRVEVTGIWTGTLSSEVSIDGGTTWVGLGLHQGAYTTATFTAGFVGGASISGATNYRIRATAAITGTAVVRVTESVNPQSVYIANAGPSGNVISTLNSSTVTLGGGATFTGTGEDVSNFSEMRITVFSNVASATDGLSIQQSTDNTNWDITDTYTIAAATGKTFVVPRQAKWFRIVYTNGAGAQASFRLSSLLNRAGTSPSSQRSSDAYTNETDLQEVWSFGSIWNGTSWDRMRGDLTGLRVKQRADTATLSNVASSATSVTLLAANTSRIGATIFNDSTQNLYVKFGTTASSSSFTVLLATNTYYEIPAGYTGILDGIWASANGNARVTEIT